MHFLGTKDKPPVYAGISAVFLMILTGITLTGTAVVLTLMTPIFVFLIPILVPAVITSSFLATGFFLASGSLGASAIALLVWFYKKEEQFAYNLHVRGVRPKEDKGSKLPGGDTPPERDKPPGKEHPTEEVKPSEKENFSERDNGAKEDKSLGGVKHAEEGQTITEISKLEQNPIGPSTSTTRSHQMRFSMDSPTKVGSIFVKEYQKVPRVGAFAYKYFTSRDKNT